MYLRMHGLYIAYSYLIEHVISLEITITGLRSLQNVDRFDSKF
jgi:hypothetical protein